MTTQSYPLVVCEIIEIPSDLRMINLRCRVAWDVPSLKFPKSSSSSSDEEFPCEEEEQEEVEVEVECQDDSKASSENELQGETNLDTETGHQEENQRKIAETSCDDQISYSDIIFSVPIQRKSGDRKDLPESLDNDPGGEGGEDEGPGLQSMLLNNFVTECEDNPGKKGLSRRRLRKSLDSL